MALRTATCTAPVNIAVIKYWGKRNEKLILPTNSSLSVTLSQDHLHAMTTVGISHAWTTDRIWLNGIEEPVQQNERLVNCLAAFRSLRSRREAKLEAQGEEVEKI